MSAVHHAPLPAASPLRQWMALCALALLAATWRLWLAPGTFPQAPCFAWCVDLPLWYDGLTLGAIITSLALMLLPSGRTGRIGCSAPLAFATALVLSALVDQERWQPWVHQMSVVGAILVLAPAPHARRLLQWFTASIYIYSAWSRIDYTFCSGLGQDFVAALLGLVGAPIERLGAGGRAVLAALFPAGEMAIGLALFWPRRRRAAGMAAIGLHVMLLVILGPLGMRQQLGVLLWNVYFIGHDWLVFVRKDVAAEQPSAAPRSSAATLLTMLAMLWPLCEPLGWCDHWPAWAVYAPRCSRVTMLVSASRVSAIREDLGQFIEATSDPAWFAVRLDLWSLSARAAPIYPQERVQLSVVRAVAIRYNLGHGVRAVAQGAAGRLTGERRKETLTGLPEIEAAQRRFLLNTRPRWPRET